MPFWIEFSSILLQTGAPPVSQPELTPSRLSMAFAGYRYRFEFRQGFHNNRHDRASLPDSLRWLWRNYAGR